jgi:hypothetical protein
VLLNDNYAQGHQLDLNCENVRKMNRSSRRSLGMDTATSDREMLLLTPVKIKPVEDDAEVRNASLLLVQQSHPEQKRATQKALQRGREARRVQPSRKKKEVEHVDSPKKEQKQKKNAKAKNTRGTKRKVAPDSSASQQKKVAKKKEKGQTKRETPKYTKEFREFQHFKNCKAHPKLLMFKSLPVYGGLFLSTQNKTTAHCTQGKSKLPSTIEELLEKAAHGSKENQAPALR